jgi:glycosyltransferase involved in cell wall biosynthesis
MAAGTPVIATNAGGIPEVVTHGINGFLSEIGDVESMSRQAISLLSNPALLEQFGNAAKEQAIKFDIVNIVPQYEKLYAEVLAK